MGFSERMKEIRDGFERPFWVANISELFERLSYYAAFASLARYLHETLSFPAEQAGSLTGLFGGLVWFLAAFGGTLADRLGFRRSLSLAYFILSASYFLLGSLGSPWLSPVRNAVPLWLLVGFVLTLPALGVALVKPCVVGTTARASKENVRSIGYSIYYTRAGFCLHAGRGGGGRRAAAASRRPGDGRGHHGLRASAAIGRLSGRAGGPRPQPGRARWETADDAGLSAASRLSGAAERHVRLSAWLGLVRPRVPAWFDLMEDPRHHPRRVIATASAWRAGQDAVLER